MLFSKRDSDNLDSIARSLERISERAFEQELVNNKRSITLLERLGIKKQEEPDLFGENDSLVQEIEEEQNTLVTAVRNKLKSAEKSGNMPFWEEDLFTPEELEVQ